MTAYRVHAEPPAGGSETHVSAHSGPAPDPLPDPAVDLAWSPGSAGTNIECGRSFFATWRPSPPAEDLLLLGASAYCVDKLEPRRTSADSWTRTLELSVPAARPELFAAAGLDATLAFLSGDRWQLRFDTTTSRPLDFLPATLDGLRAGAPVDVVSLFSGGLDSLCGVIDLLEQDTTARVGLVGHLDGGQATSRQELLHRRLADRYGPHRVPLYQLWLRPAPPRTAQIVPTPEPAEPTTRARSMLFITAALALASSAGPEVAVVIPENGYIGLNIPLTRAHNGSASTRTTHPHFLDRLSHAARAVGVTNPMLNPYRFATKGEMLAQSRNPVLLAELAPYSVSCSHAEAARMQQRP